MPGDEHARRQGRQQTDQNLFLERQRSEEEFAQRSAAAQTNADEVVQRARQQARGVLMTARRRADAQRDASEPSSEARGSIEQERYRADQVLEAEHAVADEQLSVERQTAARAFAEILAQERASTDMALQIERARADGLVASRDEFLAIVSHDIRNLTGSIALSVESIARAVPASSHGEALTAVARFRRISGQLTRLVSDLLDVSSIEARRLSLSPTDQSAADLARDSVDIFGPIASAKGIALTAGPILEDTRVRCDRERVQQVLANLLGNAIKFTPRGGSVAVRVEEAGADVRFSVTDSGPGVAPADVDRIFERFWRPASRDRQGLGLGLFIARTIIEAHGGRISVDSVEGQGSTFWFEIPRVA